MQPKQMYKQVLLEVKEMAEKYTLSNDLKVQIEEIEKEISNFAVKLPIVGGFNAGKSSLINTFLGDDLLPVEVLPETAIAAEVKYGPNKIIAHDHNGNQKEYALTDIKQIDANTYKHIEVFLENKKLKDLEDIILVDMPGFDSGIAEHNKAIFQYLKEGVQFLIVVECSDGSLKSSVSNFLYELGLYNLNFGVIVNKIDKVTDEMKNRVVSNMKEHVTTIKKDAAVITASDRLESGNQGFLDYLQGLDKNEIFIQQFKTKVQQIISRVKMNLQVLLNNSDSNVDAINKRIKEIETRIGKLNDQFKKEEILITHKIRNEVKENILRDVEAVLSNESHSLAISAQAGETSFNQKVNELIRPVLIASTNKQLELTFSEFITKMSIEMKDLSSIAQGVSKVNQALDGTMKKVADGFEKIRTSGEAIKKYEKLFKISVGSLAIATAVVAPWIELVLFFLPDILKVFGFNNKEKHLEKLKVEIENQAIPQIVGKIRNNIVDSLENVKEQVLSDLKTEMQEEMQDLHASLNQSIEDKQKAEHDFKSYLEQLKKDIEAIDQLAVKLG
ncbi:dynamin family protein [Cytobacillus massiliigabonensis]|uniref:dynamin family protein n=1 Tax=Cytobacillus massiliigabonensis TaxID=1871011 RepID=UPI0015E13D87|nr:dynamin family protein [Cytobacillus massiliigabonensis]